MIYFRRINISLDFWKDPEINNTQRKVGATIRYIKEKRSQEDYCNICGKHSKLTWDHVPPKAITNGEPVIANTVFTKLPLPSDYMKRYQNGIKYRSICETSNNVILGENDKVYCEFISKVRQQIASPILLPQIVVPVKINRLCRAMIGHILAAKNAYEPDVIPDKQMRKYVLSTDQKLSGIKLYTWIYPYKTIIIARDFVTKGFSTNSHPDGMISGIILSYPLAYMVSDEETNCGLDDLGNYSTKNIEDIVDITLHFETMFIKGSQDYKPFNWPINIGNDKRFSAMFALGGPVFQDDSRMGTPL